MPCPVWTASCAMGASAVLAGAYGSHGLRSRLKQSRDADGKRKLQSWMTGAHYQLLHSAMAIVSMSVLRRPTAPALLFLGGNLLFSGSIYLLTLWTCEATSRWASVRRALGMATPIGGLMYVGGWLAMITARK